MSGDMLMGSNLEVKRILKTLALLLALIAADCPHSFARNRTKSCAKNLPCRMLSIF